ncbi:Two tm domain protein [Entamoeba marina]
MAEEVHHHTFQLVEAPTNPIISLCFSLFVIALFVALIFALHHYVNFKLVKYNISIILFTVVFSVTTCFLIYFWACMTLLEAVGWSVLIVPVTCFTAFIASRSILAILQTSLVPIETNNSRTCC